MKRKATMEVQYGPNGAQLVKMDNSFTCERCHQRSDMGSGWPEVWNKDESREIGPLCDACARMLNVKDVGDGVGKIA